LRKPELRRLLVAIPLCLLVCFILAPAWKHAALDIGRSDFTSYFCANLAIRGGENPYLRENVVSVLPACHKAAPFFYAPPFLIPMTWMNLSGDDIRGAREIWYCINVGALAILAWVLKKWARSSWFWVLSVFALFTPFDSCFFQEQVDIVVLCLVMAALWKESGVSLAMAVLSKLSPLLLVVPLVVLRKWRLLLSAAAWMGVLSLVSLAFVPWQHQAYFYGVVLPDFLRGFPGLEFDMSHITSHSIARPLAAIWPSGVPGRLSTPASLGHVIVAAALAALLTWWSVKGRAIESEGNKPLIGAWLVLMTISPTIVWEHHLVFLLPPIMLVVQAILERRLSGGYRVAAAASVVLLMVPRAWVDWPGYLFPELEPVFSSGKLIAAIVLGSCCIYLQARQQAPKKIAPSSGVSS
jgi:hypothetical protein